MASLPLPRQQDRSELEDLKQFRAHPGDGLEPCRYDQKTDKVPVSWTLRTISHTAGFPGVDQ